MILTRDNIAQVLGQPLLSGESENFSEIVVPEGVVALYYSVFANLKKLKKVTLPSTLGKMESHVFEHCSSLEYIEIPEGVTRIASSAFFRCDSLKKVKLPKSLEHTGSFSFSDCTSLERIVIPDYVEGINTYAFSDCHKLKHVRLSRQLNWLGGCAFHNCTGLESVTFPLRRFTYADDVFEGCSENLRFIFGSRRPRDLSDEAHSSNLKVRKGFSFAQYAPIKPLNSLIYREET